MLRKGGVEHSGIARTRQGGRERPRVHPMAIGRDGDDLPNAESHDADRATHRVVRVLVAEHRGTGGGDSFMPGGWPR